MDGHLRTQQTQGTRCERLPWMAWICLWGLCLIRFVPPWNYDFMSDDWPNTLRAASFPSLGAAMSAGLDYLTRPLSCALQLGVFHLAGMSFMPFMLLSVAGHSLCFFMVVWLFWRWSNDLRVTFLAAVLFALLPTTSELNYWPTLILASVCCSLPAYLLSAVLWMEYARRPRLWLLTAAGLAYAAGLFSYEIGAFLPATFLFMRGKLSGRRLWISLLPFAGFLALYGAWRMTGGFGLVTQTYLPPHMRSGFVLADLWWNVQDYARWWVGGYMGMTVVNGLIGFFSLDPWSQRLFAVLSVGIGWGVAWQWTRLSASTRLSSLVDRMGFVRQVCFPLAWILVTFLPLLIGYSASRLQYLPGIGWAMLLAILLRRWASRSLTVSLGSLVFALVLVQLGTAQQWRESSHFHRTLFNSLKKHHVEWGDKKVIWFDTTALRERMVSDPFRPPGQNWLSVAQLGNAGLLRGFTVRSMVDRIDSRAADSIATVLDVEHWPRIEGEQWVWHGRFDPSDVRTNSLDEVYRLDVLHAVLEEWAP